MTDIEQLIERLEKATGPDRELDARIHCAIQGYDFFALRPESEILLFYDRKCHGDNIRMAGNIRPHTRSLDAAVALYPVIPDRVPSNPRLAAIEALRARQAKEDA